MKPTKWWIQSGIVYGVTALTGLALMWHSGEWNSVRAARLMAGVSLVFFVGGAIKYCHEKASLKRNAKPSRH